MAADGARGGRSPSAGWSSSPRRVGWLLAAVRARLLLRGVEPGDYPRGGGAPAAVGWPSGWPTSWARRTSPARRGCTLYARALGATVGRRRRPARAPAGHRAAHARRRAARSSPRSTSPATGSTATCCTSARSGSAAAPASAPAARCCPGAASGSGAEVAPGSAVFGAVPAGSPGPARRRDGPGSARGPLAERPARTPRPGSRPTPRRGAALACSRRCRSRPAASLALAGAGVAPRGRRPTGAPACVPWLAAGDRRRPGRRWPLLVLGVVRLLAVGLRAGHLPRPQPGRRGRRGRPCGCSTRPAPGCSRCTPASLTPTWLRLLGASVGKDVEASTVLLIPQLTTINDGAFLADDTLHRRVRAGRRLAADRARQDRQARVRRQLRHGRARPQGAQARAGRRALGRAAAHEGQGRDVLARQPAGPAPAHGRRRDDEPDLRPAAPAPGRPRGLVEVCRLRAGDGRTSRCRRRRAGRAGRARASSRSLAWLAAASSGVVLRRRRALVAACVATVAKWLLVGRMRPPSTRCGARSSGATSWPTRSSRWSPRRGSPGPHRARRCSTSGCASLGARIGRGVWCETYWLPEADLVDLGDGATVNQGCVVQTHLFHDRVLSMDTVSAAARARPSVRTA